MGIIDDDNARNRDIALRPARASGGPFPLHRTITLGRAVGIPGYTITSSDWRKHPGDILVQTDYDYPGVATAFGWNLGAIPIESRPDAVVFCPSDHAGTDGTIDCPDCGSSAAYLIAAADAYLRDNPGMVAPDPGYFD